MVNNDGDKITNPKDILEEEERFFEEIYTSRYMDPNCLTFSEFFKTENALSEEIAKTCEGVMSVHECELALITMENNKTPGTDGLTPEFYRYSWNLLGSFMGSSFNYAFRNGTLSISTLRDYFLNSEKEENYRIFKKLATCIFTEFFTDYKIATKTIALRLEKILPNLIHPCHWRKYQVNSRHNAFHRERDEYSRDSRVFRFRESF